MNRALLVAKHEFLTLVRRKSFIILVLSLPILAMLLFAVLRATSPSPEAMAEEMMPKPPTVPYGYVDDSGLVQSVPLLMQGSYTRFGTIPEAQAATRAGTIAGFYYLAPDYVSTGEVDYYSKDFNPLGSLSQTAGFEFVIASNLADGPAEAARLWQPMALTTYAMEARGADTTSDVSSFWLPYVILMVLYMSLSFATGWLLQTVTDEKDSRMIEIMLSTVSAEQMLAGKTLGLGAAGLLQFLIWTVTVAIGIALGGSTLRLPEGFSLGVDVYLLTTVFFLLGYMLYASLVAGLGAMAPSLRDAQQAIIIVYLPMLLPMWFLSALFSEPNGTLSAVLSLIPFTAPVAMVVRLVNVVPPAWQLIASMALLLLTAVLAILVAARLFRAQNLLAGQSVSWSGLLAALRAE